MQIDEPKHTGMPALLECTNIYMGFGGIAVLNDINLTLHPGTVTALAGENGAGKSTLMKIASGQYIPDQGSVKVDGHKLTAGNIQEAHRLGVAIVPQELASVPELSVYENLFVGREITVLGGILNRSQMAKECHRRLKDFGLSISPHTRMGSLPVGIRQIIEIIKATSKGVKVLLLDEPSSAISENEVSRLYAAVEKLRNEGVAVLFTTHKMEEMRAMADRVIVLRDGKLVTDSSIEEITDDAIVTAMIGRELVDMFPTVEDHLDEVCIEVQELCITPESAPINFKVHKGEILGLAGLVGAGRTELMETLFGMRKPYAGQIRIAGKQLKSGDPSAAILAGLAMVPEDRKASGAILSMDVLDNGSLPRLKTFTKCGWISNRSRSKAVGTVMESLKLKSRGLSQKMSTLSGGNQQKVVLGRWLTGSVNVLLLDEPTRGVDVGARAEIYRIIAGLASQGMAVIMASSDMPEVLSLSHRAFVMRNFSTAGDLHRTELRSPNASDKIFRLASGLSATSTTAPKVQL